MPKSGTFEINHRLTDEEERHILSARAELASRRCDGQRLAAILEVLVLRPDAGAAAEMNARLDEHAELRGEAA